MISKPLTELRASDIESLIEAGVLENKRLEYKRGYGRDAGLEFLKDVSAFANADGGDLVVGVEENNGVPTAIVGVPKSDADKLKQWFVQLAANGLEPRLPKLEVELVEVDATRCLIVVRVEQSWLRPHMVQPKDHGRFYVRNAAGKQPMDGTEIRNMVLGASETIVRLERWHSDRIDDLLAQKTQPRIGHAQFGHICILPLAAFHGAVSISASELVRNQDRLGLLGEGPLTRRLIVDGFVATNGQRAFARTWRSGIMEAATNSWFLSEGGRQYFRALQMEQECADWIDLRLRSMKDWSLSPPYVVRTTICRAEGFHPYVDRTSNFVSEPQAFDREKLVLPDVWVEDASQPARGIVNSLMESVWNAAGRVSAPKRP